MCRGKCLWRFRNTFFGFSIDSRMEQIVRHMDVTYESECRGKKGTTYALRRSRTSITSNPATLPNPHTPRTTDATRRDVTVGFVGAAG